MATGTVKWFNNKRGYGFITSDDADGDIFVHYSSVNVSGYKTLSEGDEVSFTLIETDRGNEAKNVIVTRDALQ